MKKGWQKRRESWIEPKRSGNSGRYFMVRNWDSEKGLSLETYGREWVLVTPRSASSWAMTLDFIEEPRSACSVSWPSAIDCFRQVSVMSCWASVADSR